MSDGSPRIPQASPARDYALQKAELDDAIARVIAGGRYILGDEVASFEHEFAAYLGVEHGVGVANGTDALELALRGAGIAVGQHVATVSHTAVATVAAIERSGATPVFVDVDPVTMTLDPQLLDDTVRRRENTRDPIRGVVLVHLYGQPADVGSVLEIARAHGIVVIEDCAQANGANVLGRKVGTFADAAAFSFYPTKNLGAVGDGGMVATNDQGLADRVRQLRQYGWRQRFISDLPGFNSRLDEIQAAILRVKLRSLDSGNARRREIADQYDSALAGTNVRSPAHVASDWHVFHQYVVRATNRDALGDWLKGSGVDTAIHYPVPVHLQPAYRERIPIEAPLPVTEGLASEILSLPMFPALLDEEVARVGEALRSVGNTQTSGAGVH